MWASGPYIWLTTFPSSKVIHSDHIFSTSWFLLVIRPRLFHLAAMRQNTSCIYCDALHFLTGYYWIRARHTFSSLSIWFLFFKHLTKILLNQQKNLNGWIYRKLMMKVCDMCITCGKLLGFLRFWHGNPCNLMTENFTGRQIDCKLYKKMRLTVIRKKIKNLIYSTILTTYINGNTV